MCAVFLIILLMFSAYVNVFADETFTKIQEMVNDLGGPQNQKKNNGKVLKCANSGSKKITITSKGGSTTYSGVYNNCREFGSIRDGNVEITIGGGGNSSAKITEPDHFSYSDSWDIACDKNMSTCFASSGTIEITYNGKTGKITKLYGIPKVNHLIEEGYKQLNKYFGKKVTPLKHDENLNFLLWLSKRFESNKQAWSFCREQNDKQSEIACNLSPTFNAAKYLVDFYNNNQLYILVNSYLIDAHYYKDTPKEQLIIKGDDQRLYNIVRWCAYAPCTNDFSVVTATKNGAPYSQNVTTSYEFFENLANLSESPKQERGKITNFDGSIMEDADEPAMYKKALAFITNSYDYWMENINKAKTFKGSNADLFLEDFNAGATKWIANKLVNSFKIADDKAYLLSATSLSGIYRNTTKTGDMLRHIKYGTYYNDLDLPERENRYLPIKIADKYINPKQLQVWLNELEEKAISKIQTTIQKAPNDVKSWVMLGYVYLNIGQSDKAVEPLNKATQLNPKDAFIWYQLGLLNKKINKYEEALSNFDKSLAIDDTHVEVFYYAGVICFENLNDKERAKKYWTKVIEKEPESDRTRYIKSKLLL